MTGLLGSAFRVRRRGPSWEGKPGSRNSGLGTRDSAARILCLFFFFLAADASGGRSAGSSALIIGKLPVGSRAIALSGAYAAIANGPDAVYWNPAGLAGVGRTRMEGLHVEQGEQIRLENLLVARQMAEGATLGLGASYLNQPPLVETLEDSSGNFAGTGGTFAAYGFKGAVGYGQDLSRLAPVPLLGVLWSRGSVGAALTMLGEGIADTRAFSTSLDLGYLYEDANAGRSVGVVVRQLGMKVHGSPLPVTAEVGVGQMMRSLLVTFDVLTAVDDALRFRGGVEWRISTVTGGVSLRAGLQHSLSSYLSAPFSAGLGYDVGMEGGFDFSLDYAFVPVADFDDMHAISIQIGL